MELVIDANILFSALIRDSNVRRFLLFSGHSFYVPEFIFEEINEHIEEIRKKTLLSKSEIREILDFLLVFGNIKIIPLDEIKNYRNEALKISPDPDDAPYVALALKLKCAIWSNDKSLKEKQDAVKVYNSEEVLRMK